MKGKRILVTGGLGFIGLSLVRSLKDKKYEFILFDNLSQQIHGALPNLDLSDLAGVEYTILRGDTRYPNTFNEALGSVDYVVHLAAETGTAQSMYKIAHYNQVNTQGTAELLDWLANHKHKVKKFILASSRSIYGEGAYRCETCGVVTPESRTADALAMQQWEPRCPFCMGDLALTATPENARPKPASIYAATKLAQEDLVRIGCDSMGIPWVNLRFQNVYGAGQSLNNPYTGLLSIFSTRIRRGLNLPIFEDGLESRDFVHVNDIARTIATCLESAEVDGKVLNAGSGVPTRVIDVAQMLNQVFGGKSRIEVTGQYRVGDIRHCYADISSLHKFTGYTPRMDLESGLATFAAWVSGQPLPEDNLDKANQMLLDRGLMK